MATQLGVFGSLGRSETRGVSNPREYYHLLAQLVDSHYSVRTNFMIPRRLALPGDFSLSGGSCRAPLPGGAHR